MFFQLEEIDGIPIVAPLQLYLDLQRDPARGEEAADALLEQNLKPAWKAMGLL